MRHSTTEPWDWVIWLVMLGPASARTLFAQMTSQSASTRTKWLTYLITMRAIHDVARPRSAAPAPFPKVHLIREAIVTQ